MIVYKFRAEWEHYHHRSCAEDDDGWIKKDFNFELENRNELMPMILSIIGIEYGDTPCEDLKNFKLVEITKLKPYMESIVNIYDDVNIRFLEYKRIMEAYGLLLGLIGMSEGIN